MQKIFSYKEAEKIRSLDQRGRRERRLRVLDRDGYRCWYCGDNVTESATDPRKKPTVDHLTPITQGGGEDLSNLVTACVSCNSRKSGFNLEQYRDLCLRTSGNESKAIASLESVLASVSTPYNTEIEKAIAWLKSQQKPIVFFGEGGGKVI